MDKLNRKQRIAVWILLAVAVLMFLFPPVIWSWDGRTYFKFFLSFDFRYDIKYQQLLMQYVLLAGIGWAVVTSLKSKAR